MNITLTQDQIELIARPIEERCERQIRELEAKAARSVAANKRRADARVEAARQRTSEWKQSYSDARSRLLAAQAEIVELKRRIREGYSND